MQELEREGRALDSVIKSELDLGPEGEGTVYSVKVASKPSVEEAVGIVFQESLIKVQASGGF